jgi:acyl transferase domain-containing protein
MFPISIVRQVATRATQVAVSSLGDVRESEWSDVERATAELWRAGVPIDWRALHLGNHRRVVSLPSYPFARSRHLLELPSRTAEIRAPSAVPSDVEEPSIADLLAAQLQVIEGQLEALSTLAESDELSNEGSSESRGDARASK